MIYLSKYSGGFMLAIGLMSGTSMDGIDAAVIETDGETRISELGHISVPYADEFRILLKAAEYAVRKHAGDVSLSKANFSQALNEYLTQELKLTAVENKQKIQKLSDYLALTYDAIIEHSTKLHAQAVNKLLRITKISAAKIEVVGYHGQTLYHAPEKHITIQAGDGGYLARELGIKVVNDFRRRDVELGGQGAPFAPLYHLALAMRDNIMPAVIVNCGGISNVTIVNSSNLSDLYGFDTGPGNVLVDRLIRQRTHGKELFDKDGKYGAKGKVHPSVIQKLYDSAIIKNGKNYFELPPPKSLDYNDIKLIPELENLSIEDASATLAAFTADSIVKSVQHKIPNWILSGGGWKNPVIKRELQERLPGTKVHTADEIGWNNKALEAQVFAYLAVRCLLGKPISVPSTTRVPKPVTGGQIHAPVEV